MRLTVKCFSSREYLWLFQTETWGASQAPTCLLLLYISCRPCGASTISAPPTSAAWCAVSHLLMKLRGLIRNKETCSETCGGVIPHAEKQRMNPGTGAEGYYDHVAILHFVVWRRCARTTRIRQICTSETIRVNNMIHPTFITHVRRMKTQIIV